MNEIGEQIMKKTSLTIVLASALLLVQVPLETWASASNINTETTLVVDGQKKNRYKKKRGGLFNTGLFRKKNKCGCPKH